MEVSREVTWPEPCLGTLSYLPLHSADTRGSSVQLDDLASVCHHGTIESHLDPLRVTGPW